MSFWVSILSPGVMTCRATWDLDYHGDDDDHRHSNDVGEGDDEDADLQ